MAHQQIHTTFPGMGENRIYDDVILSSNELLFGKINLQRK
jgi:hypothetical protein